MVDLSIIIVSYNTAKITKNCIESILKSVKDQINYEIIVVDNASTDNSLHEIQDFKIRIIKNRDNIGFARANNQAVREAEGRYILFLNSDVEVKKIDFKKLIDYLDDNKKVGALTVKVNLTSGEIDPASHRGFPTLWRSFTYFSGLEFIFGKLSLFKNVFGGYHLLDNDFTNIHEIDSPSGAFFLTRKELFEEIKGFDEKFFMYGEDLDLAYRIKEKNYSVIYYPGFEVVHLKYQSGLQKDKKVARAIKRHFYEAMEIFYKKHYEPKYNFVVNSLVYLLINLKEIFS